MNQQKRRVVVTGLGTINPLGNDVPTTWQKIRQGESGIDTLTAFDASEYKTTFAGEVKSSIHRIILTAKKCGACRA